MRNILPLLALAGCGPVGAIKPSTDSAPADTGSGAVDTDGDTSTAPTYTPALPTLATVGSYGIGALYPTFAGYSMLATEDGALVSEVSTGLIRRCAYEGTGEIDEDCEPALSGQEWSVDKMQTDGDAISIADALGAGIAYGVGPAATGALADVADLAVSGGYDGGYTGVILHLDADGDGEADDVVATSGLYGDLGWSDAPDGGYYGELAVFLDAPVTGSLAWTDAALYLPACADGDRKQWGPVQTATDGSTLAAACPGYGYRGGAVEGWVLPLTERAADWSVEASGWYLAVQPDGGYVADYRGYGLEWIQPTAPTSSARYPSRGSCRAPPPTFSSPARGGPFWSSAHRRGHRRGCGRR